MRRTFTQIFIHPQGRVKLKKLEGNIGVAEYVVKLTGVGRKSLEVGDDPSDSAHEPVIDHAAPKIDHSQVEDVALKHNQAQQELSSQKPTAASELHYPKAFVSHATQDHRFVQEFASDLRKHGVDAFRNRRFARYAPACLY